MNYIFQTLSALITTGYIFKCIGFSEIGCKVNYFISIFSTKVQDFKYKGMLF